MSSASPTPRGPLSFWTNTPLYLRIMGGLVLGVLAGVLLGSQAEFLAIPAKLVLRLLGALAPPLILVAIIRALITANIAGKTGARLIGLLLLNTLVAICIGLFVANLVHPGQFAHLAPDPTEAKKLPHVDTLTALLENVPKSLFGPLGDDGKVIGVIFIAVAFGLALRQQREKPVLMELLDILMSAIVTILGWIIEVVPLAVFGVVASIIGTKGFAPFKALGAFILAVLLALILQGIYYLARVRFGSWVRPRKLLFDARDAMVMAFSTSSSTITMPVTYDRLRNRVGLREESASLGALVGSNFNNDGTALYEAMAALFISQMLGRHLGLEQQVLVVLMSVVASVGAAGIPEAGLVTMTLVFGAVGLPPEYIAVLLPVDWFLDRSRTVINMMGDMSVACLLDGKVAEKASL